MILSPDERSPVTRDFLAVVCRNSLAYPRLIRLAAFGALQNVAEHFSVRLEF
jgi:hypothetical protein